MNPELSPARHLDSQVRFAHQVTRAIEQLKHRLQAHYERLHPSQPERIRVAIAEAELLASRLSVFPHLFLPDLVEVRIAELALQPVAADEPVFSHAA
jgi:hypothetical protein